MALQVWMPFTDGTLKQQGLSNITPVGSAFTINNNGKLGKCIQTTDAGHIDLGYNGNQANTGSISFGGWFKINKTDLLNKIGSYTYTDIRTTPTGNLIGNNSYGGIGLIWSTNNMYSSGGVLNNLYVTCSIRSTQNGARSTNSSEIPFDTWVNIYLVFNKTNKILQLWINGELKQYSSMLTFDDIRDYNLLLNYNAVWGGNGPSFNIPFLANDIRIYDHALSPMEVKQLSQGLILHYPLNRNSWGQENLAKNTNGVIIDGLGSTPGSRHEYYAFNCGTPFSVDAGDTVTISFDLYETVNTAGSGYLYVYNTNNKGPHQIAGVNVLADRTIAVGDIIDERISFTTTISNRSDATQTNDFIEFYSNYGTSNWFKISNLKVEKGSIPTPWCPNSSDALATTMGLNSITEYDCSGFCNNGTRTGTFSWTSNTPKYVVSQVFNGTDNAIQTPSLPTMITDKNYTIAVWIYKTVIGSKGYQTIYGGPSGFEIEARNGGANETKFVPWNWGKPMASYELNEWNHCVFVHSDADCKIYLNGEYIATGTAKASNPTGNYFIGAWNTATQQNFDGLMSDFRIYATALSANDVLSLYQNTAVVDDSTNPPTIYGKIRD